MERSEARKLLILNLNNVDADFREGQWEAIDTLVNKREKLLVVQRTGWGKSAVYFISAKIFREQGSGPTIIISPLLALMRNQIEAAKRLGIRAATINSSNKDEWGIVNQQILNDKIDCLLISPERLANDEFIEEILLPISNNIALMVIDEAHCISDWGHDFRPDYRRIVNILRQLPTNLSVLGTTATANNRVIADIQTQLGNINIQRGSLIRESLSLQTMILQTQAARLVWLIKTIPQLQGTGIIYTLTVRDAEQVAKWLKLNGIKARAYHSSVEHDDFEDSNTYRQYLEEQLMSNQLKVLVATTALGMGYDKPDLGFVIHYQAPGSIVGYYQQVGRAGRAIDNAVGVLLSGNEDKDIHEFFRESAFPDENHIHEILSVLEQSDGLSIRELEKYTNLKNGQIEKVLKLLSVENPAPLIKIGNNWCRTPIPYQMDKERISHLTHQRELEWREVQDYIQTSQCKMLFLQHSLDDEIKEPCGKCSSCLGRLVIDIEIDQSEAHEALMFLKHSEITITPKKQVAANALVEYGFKGNLSIAYRLYEGRALSRWNDAGWGVKVAEGKHNGYFSDDLVEAMIEMIVERWKPNPFPQWICCVPSKTNPQLVPNFARRVATRLNLPFLDVISKIKDNKPQKLQQNRFHQCHNLDGVFKVVQDIPKTPALLIDDIIDSGWTFAVIGALMAKSGCEAVYPVALASATAN